MEQMQKQLKQKKLGAILHVSALATALALAGCGGGGSGFETIQPGGNGDGGGTSGGGGSTGGGTSGGGTTVQPSINVAEMGLYDAKGNNTVSVGLSGANVQVKVVNEKNQPVENAKVTFSSDAGELLKFANTSASALTDANGIAQLLVKPTSAAVSGAYTLSAVVAYEELVASKKLNVTVQPTNITLSPLTVNTTNLDAGKTTPVSLQVKDDSNIAVDGVNIGFTASCGSIPSSATSANGGKIQVVYKTTKADGTLCPGGDVTITATPPSGTGVQTATVTVAQPLATSIVYPNDGVLKSIGLKDSGTSGQAEIKFKVYANTTPLSNQPVEFSLVKSPNGTGINVTEAVTDENGEVSVIVMPGSTAGPVEIEAKVKGTTYTALAKNISVVYSRASQDKVSLAFSSNNLEAWTVAGVKSTITAYVADRFGNAVPDGTVVNFYSESGQIQGTCETKQDENKISKCSAVYSSQAPKPADGRVSILALVEGDKAFKDKVVNGQVDGTPNFYDKGTDTLLRNIGDTFLDENENLVYDSGEPVYTQNNRGSEACLEADGKVTKLAFGEPNIPNTCHQDASTILREQAVILLSGSFAHIQYLPNPKDEPQKLWVKIYSVAAIGDSVNSTKGPLLPMPGGTKFSAKAETVTEQKDRKDCELVFQSGYETMPSVIDTGVIGTSGKVPDLGTYHGFETKNCLAGDKLIVITETESGAKTKIQFTMHKKTDANGNVVKDSDGKEILLW